MAPELENHWFERVGRGFCAKPTSWQGRLLTGVNPCTRAGAVTLLAPLVTGAGVVWVRHPAEDGWDGRAEQERATAVLR